MATPFRYAISLRVHGLGFDPQAVSNELQLPMTASWRTGDARVTPRGRRLGGRRTDTYCCLKIASGDDGQLAQSLVAASAKLMRHELFLHRLREAGATMYFYVFWYPNGDTGEVFPTSLLLELGRLGIDLGINVYDDRHGAVPADVG